MWVTCGKGGNMAAFKITLCVQLWMAMMLPIPLLWKALAMPSWWDYLPVTSASTQWSPAFALHFLYRHRVENRHCAPDMFVLPPFLRKQLDIKQVSPGLAFSQTFLQSIFVFIYFQWHQNCQRKNKKNIFIFGNVCLTLTSCLTLVDQNTMPGEFWRAIILDFTLRLWSVNMTQTAMHNSSE